MLSGCGRLGFEISSEEPAPATDGGGRTEAGAPALLDAAVSPRSSPEGMREAGAGVCGARCWDAGMSGSSDEEIDDGGSSSPAEDASLEWCQGLLNCGFDDGGAGWGSFAAPETGGSIEFVDGQLRVSRSSNFGQSALQLRQDNLPLEPNTTYLLEFDGYVASGHKTVWFFLYYDNRDGNRSNYCGAALSTSLQRFSCEYSTAARDAYGFGMDFGGEVNTADIIIDNIAILPL